MKKIHEQKAHSPRLMKTKSSNLWTTKKQHKTKPKVVMSVVSLLLGGWVLFK
jgi:hypothetical protein